MISRRGWVQSIVSGGVVLFARRSAGQEPAAQVADTSNLFPMDQSAARLVRLPPKPGAAPSMSPEERNGLEHRIRCQCGCTLDVYTCRTTDFSCQVSPAMHRDVLALVQGGHSAQEILDAFVNVYGEQVLMAPPKVGFNILGYVVPGIAIAIGAVVLWVVMRRWRRAAVRHAATPTSAARAANATALDATPAELARLETAVRDDG